MSLFRRLNIRHRIASLSLPQAALAATVLTIGSAGGAQAYDELPSCDAPGVLGQVKSQLKRAEFFYRDTATFAGLEQPYELSSHAQSSSPLMRRYCSVRVYSDYSQPRTAYYMVEEDAGFLGLSWNVEACLPGLDDWHVYGRHCQTVRPN